MPRTTLRKTLRSRGHRALIELIVSTRNQAGLTQRDLAARLKRPHSFVGRIEAGERRVDVVEFIEIARVLEMEPTLLFVNILKKANPSHPRFSRGMKSQIAFAARFNKKSNKSVSSLYVFALTIGSHIFED